MDSYAEILEQTKSISIFGILDDIFKQNRVQQEVIRLNQEQLQGGEDALAQTIVTIGGSPYRASTVQIKKEKRQPTNVVTLKDTGEFYNTFSVIIRRDGYEIIADFRKGSDDIRDNFSSKFDFLGLTEDNLDYFVHQELMPRLEKRIRTQLKI